MVREWMIFAICLGFGGHVALGLILHAPDLWSWQNAGRRGLLIGLGVYAMAQLVRSLWWIARRRSSAGTST